MLTENVCPYSHHFNHLTHQITYANGDTKLLGKAVFRTVRFSEGNYEYL